MKTYILPSLLILLGTGASDLAQAMDGPASLDDKAKIFVGVQTLVASEHLGSAEDDISILPYLSVDDYKGVDIFGPSISYRAIETGTGVGLGKWSLRAGPIATYQTGRNSGDSATLTGLDDIDGSLLLGGYARATFGPVGLRLDVGQDVIGGHDGLIANASIGTLLPLGKLNIQPSATVSWGSESFNQTFFGITPEQAAASGLDINDTGSGIYSYSLSAVSWLELTDKYTISLIGSHSWFTEEAKNSPIILAEDGSDTGFFVSVGFSRKFTL